MTYRQIKLFHGAKLKNTSKGWIGNCPEHGFWINYYKDGCVYEQWEEERKVKNDPPPPLHLNS